MVIILSFTFSSVILNILISVSYNNLILFVKVLAIVITTAFTVIMINATISYLHFFFFDFGCTNHEQRKYDMYQCMLYFIHVVFTYVLNLKSCNTWAFVGSRHIKKQS